MTNEKNTEAASEERLSLEGRRLLRVTGVREVLRIEDEAVVLQTQDQLLVVRGRELRLRQLTPQEGRVELRGRVDALSFEQDAASRGLLRRLLG